MVQNMDQEDDTDEDLGAILGDMKELSSKDFRSKPGTQKRVPGLAGVDEFYYGLTHEGQKLCVQGKFQHSREIASTQLLDINLSSGSEDFPS